MQKLEVNLMATKKRFKEAELIDQNETQAQAVPATDDEVAQAAPTEAAPVEASPVEDDAVLPEGTEGEDVGAEAQVNPETISVEVQIPTDQLASAVAQATGDLEVANLSPDVQAAQEGELVADGASEVEGEDIPVEGATEEAPADQSADLGPQLESQECGKEDKLTEDVFTANSETEGQDNYGKGDSSDEDYQAGKDTAEKHEQPRLDMIDHAIKVEGESLNEGIEDKVVSEDPAEVIGNAADDELPPGMDGGIDDDIDPALLDGEGDIPGLEGDEVAIDEDDPAVQDFLSKIDGYLADEDAQPAQVADALRASADFFDAIAPEDEDIDDEDLLDVEEGEDEGEIPLDLDAIETGDVGGKTGDEVLDEFATAPEDYDESLVRVPCKFPKKRFGEKKVARELPLVRENKKLKEKGIIDFTSIDPYDYEGADALIKGDDWSYERDEHRLELIDEYNDLVANIGVEKISKALAHYVCEKDYQLFEDFLVDATEGGIPESYYESKKSVGKKLEEAVDYSAVKFPAGSEAEGEDLVEAYEKTQASRRKAIKNFRESVIKNNENNVAPRNSRFAEALKSSVRTNSRPSSSSSNSWSNNRFVEKMEEREELDFKALIRDGFLG